MQANFIGHRLYSTTSTAHAPRRLRSATSITHAPRRLRSAASTTRSLHRLRSASSTTILCRVDYGPPRQIHASAASTTILRRVDSGPPRRIHASAASTPIHRVEYIFDYRVLTQMRLATLGGFALKICIYSHSRALTKGYGSRQQTTEILRASPSASTSTHPRGLLRVDVDCCS
jgi:hypothetical protein